MNSLVAAGGGQIVLGFAMLLLNGWFAHLAVEFERHALGIEIGAHTEKVGRVMIAGFGLLSLVLGVVGVWRAL